MHYARRGGAGCCVQVAPQDIDAVCASQPEARHSRKGHGAAPHVPTVVLQYRAVIYLVPPQV